MKRITLPVFDLTPEQEKNKDYKNADIKHIAFYLIAAIEGKPETCGIIHANGQKWISPLSGPQLIQKIDDSISD